MKTLYFEIGDDVEKSLQYRGNFVKNTTVIVCKRCSLLKFSRFFLENRGCIYIKKD